MTAAPKKIMVDRAYIVKSIPLGAFTGSFQHFAVTVTDILKMCMKEIDAEKIFFNKLTGLLFSHFITTALKK